jgi:hypothetical protein
MSARLSRQQRVYLDYLLLHSGHSAADVVRAVFPCTIVTLSELKCVYRALSRLRKRGLIETTPCVTSSHRRAVGLRVAGPVTPEGSLANGASSRSARSIFPCQVTVLS